MEDGVIGLDPDRRVTWVNAAASRLLGNRAVVGAAFLDFVRDPDSARVARGEIDDAEISLGIPARTVLLSGRTGTDGGRVIVLRDVTDLRRLERMRRDFVANVSHELKTPASVLRANAELLLDGALDDKVAAAKLVAGMHRQAERLGRLVDDLLNIARIEEGRYPIDAQRIDLSPLADRVRDLLEGRATARGQRVLVEMDSTMGVIADPYALEQVLLNLVENGLKYGREGVELVVAAHRVDHRVRIEVIDDGPGIEPHHRERIFERFYRADAGRSRELGGTGLGLAIARHLVQAMGGRIGVEPKKPRGSVFWVELEGPD